MVGAVAGTPGTLPTNWGTLISTGGLTRTITALGTENGLQYIDIRFAGTATSSVCAIGFDLSNSAAAAINQVWTNSFYVKNIQTTAQADTVSIGFYEYNAAAGYVTEGTSNIKSQITAQLNRFSFTRTLTGATTAFVQTAIRFGLTIGATYDFTIRIAAPQMELGSYATTFIPTTTAAVTRLADTCSLTGASSIIGQTEGTLFADINLPTTTESVRQLQVSDGTLGNRIQIATNGANLSPAIVLGTVVQAVFTIPYTTGNYKIAIAYANNDVVLYVNGALVGTDTSATIPTCSRIDVGNSLGQNQAGHGITQAAIYTTRLSNAELQSLTTL